MPEGRSHKGTVTRCSIETMAARLPKLVVPLLFLLPCVGAGDAVVSEFIETYCAVCHNPQAKAGALDLTGKLQSKLTWEKVLGKLNSGQMPPKGALLPSGEQIALVVQWIETELARVTTRPLNRLEYMNAVRDLVGISIQLTADEFDIKDDHRKTAHQIAKSHKQIFLCGHAFNQHTSACARQILTPLASRAFGRPASGPEVVGLVHLVDMAKLRGESFEAGIQIALETILVHPNFLSRSVEVPEKVGVPQ